MTTPIDSRIFRAYDIRGLAYEQITEHVSRAIGRAFGTELRLLYEKDHPTVCVGRDARTHGPAFQLAAIEGLIEAGCHVFDIGQTPTPLNYYTICTMGFDGGLQVSASHNPKEDNGFKLSLRNAAGFFGEKIQDLRKRIERQDVLTGEGRLETLDAITPYVAHLSSQFAGVGEGLNIVVDSGNGVAGPIYCDVLRRVGATLSELYTEPDGTFPNHHADPSQKSTLKMLQATVQDVGAHAGIAFDGDGDRMGLVDEKGVIRTADELLLLLAKDHLSRHPGALVVFTVSNSGILKTEVEAMGGKPVMGRVGRSFVAQKMREVGAQIGGEVSGHMFFGEDYFGFDDALVAALRLLSILKQSSAPVSSLLADFPKVFQSQEMRPKVPDERKSEIIREVTNHFLQSHEVHTLDGARIEFGDGAWAAIRQSNTSPRLSICIEARSPEALYALEKQIRGHMEKYPEIEWDSAH